VRHALVEVVGVVKSVRRALVEVVGVVKSVPPCAVRRLLES
jgi:hypothetical protein